MQQKFEMSLSSDSLDFSVASVPTPMTALYPTGISTNLTQLFSMIFQSSPFLSLGALHLSEKATSTISVNNKEYSGDKAPELYSNTIDSLLHFSSSNIFTHSISITSLVSEELHKPSSTLIGSATHLQDIISSETVTSSSKSYILTSTKSSHELVDQVSRPIYPRQISVLSFSVEYTTNQLTVEDVTSSSVNSKNQWKLSVNSGSYIALTVESSVTNWMMSSCSIDETSSQASKILKTPGLLITDKELIDTSDKLK